MRTSEAGAVCVCVCDGVGGPCIHVDWSLRRLGRHCHHSTNHARTICRPPTTSTPPPRPRPRHSVHIALGPDGRPNGMAFVEFDSEDAAAAGLQKDRHIIGSRYIEVFLSTADERARYG
jgi:hypothetical protein